MALLVACVFAAAPLSGTVCLALCMLPVPSAAGDENHGGHHGAGPTGCHETDSTGRPRIGAPGHDCLDHVNAVRDDHEAIIAGRADTALVTAAQHSGPSTPAFPGSATRHDYSGSTLPSGVPSPTSPPLVLRI